MNTPIIKAIADETRLRILVQIAKGELCACKIPAIVKKTQPAVSQHLKVLLGAGLVAMRKDGVKRLYSLSKTGKRVLEDISRW
jgi:ArsR family transcriptional regulator